MKLFKISIITLVCFGVVHFITDKLFVNLMKPDAYLELKMWVGIITVVLTIVVFISLVFILLKFIAKKL